MEDRKIRIAAFTGSLRRNSYNRAALRAAAELLPENAVMDIIDLAGIPFFSEDLEAEGIPPAVAEFKRRLGEADAVLIATPEYNFSIPPVLKNAFDWASRGENLPLSGKPAAIMSASTGMLGGARVQYHLRQVLVALNLRTLNKPEVFITNADTKFDKDGRLLDERTRNSISRLVTALVQSVESKGRE